MQDLEQDEEEEGITINEIGRENENSVEELTEPEDFEEPIEEDEDEFEDLDDLEFPGEEEEGELL